MSLEASCLIVRLCVVSLATWILYSCGSLVVGFSILKFWITVLACANKGGVIYTGRFFVSWASTFLAWGETCGEAKR